MKKKCLLVSILFYSIIFTTQAQSVNPVFLQEEWDARWISVPDIDNQAYGVYYFRKSFDIIEMPETFIVYVSGDNRYKLYLNEELVSLGPARCDLDHWNFEIVDLAPFLKPGKNLVAAVVWNDGNNKGEAQISFKTGFILQGTSEVSAILNTNTSWKCIQDKSYSIPEPGRRPFGYSVVPPNEKADMNKHIAGWQKLSFDDDKWQNAVQVWGGIPKNMVGIDSRKRWRLVPSPLPQMELTYQRLKKVRKTEGVSVPPDFASEKTSFTVPANTAATILLDQTFLTNAYPTFIFSNGKNSIIKICYAESLFEKMEVKNGSNLSYINAKNNRNEVEGKFILGNSDVVISNGEENQVFEPLWFRTYRYVELKVETKEEPLIIHDFYGTFTGYPLQFNARLDTDIKELDKMLEIGWHSLRLSAGETYRDPYFEQLQYIGDTRIQAMITLFNSGDDRLIKNALNWFDLSRRPEGNTLSRYPTRNPQMIPTFSLLYIGMVHDYMMYGPDIEFVKRKLPGIRMIINYFNEFQDESGSLKNVPNWAFVDWAGDWHRGEPPVGKDGSSAILDLHLLLAYQYALDLEKNLGMSDYQVIYSAKVEQLSETIKNKYWDESRMLFADTPEKNEFSQHTNSLAVLAGVLEGKKALSAGRLLLADSSLTEASIYFKYYVHQALAKAGLGDDYLNWLNVWRKSIELGLTTWGETSEVETTRSDCHAWGATPNIDIFQTILGIHSDAPGFRKVKIEPHLGDIKNIGGEMPHPNGKIKVKYTTDSGSLKAEIILPDNISGIFIWEGKIYKLKEGENLIKI